MKCLPLLLLATLFASCASLSVPTTGFLENREQLTRNEDHEVWGVPDGVDLYVAPDLDASKYDSVFIAETVYMPSASARHTPSEKSLAKLKANFSKYLGKRLSRDFTLVDKPGPRTLHVRAAIAEVVRERVWLNILTVILIVPVDMGGIAGQIEVLDSLTGERLIAMAAHRDGTPFLVLECFGPYDHADWGMRKWATKMRSILDASRPLATAPNASKPLGSDG